MLQGCNRFEKEFGIYAESVKVSTLDNALRAKVLIKYKRSCTYEIQYWEKSQGEKEAKYTKPRKVESGEDTQVLRFLNV